MAFVKRVVSREVAVLDQAADGMCAAIVDVFVVAHCDMSIALSVGGLVEM